MGKVLLSNGSIYTQDPRNPVASAVAIDGQRILAVGDNDSVRSSLAGEFQNVNLQGRCIVPGLVDAHVHYRSYAIGLRRIDLSGAENLNEALQNIAARANASPSQGWLLGRGWNQSAWPEDRFPTASDLDNVVSDRPVLFSHKSGHAAWVNSKALRMAQVSASTPDPPGGQIQRDDRGRPTGILFEDAMDLVYEFVPEPTESEIVTAMLDAQELCLRAGLTGIHDFDGRSCFRALQTIHSNNRLKLRVVKNIPVYRMEHAVGVGIRSGFGDDWLRIGGVKIFADGALGSRTAAMIEPYESEPENRGIVVTDKEDMFNYANLASSNGLSVTVHAIGDRANHDVIDVFQAVRAEEYKRSTGDSGNNHKTRLASDAQTEDESGLRHRIEHAQLLHPGDFERLAKYQIIASMQPIHATADMDMADRHWGDRAEYAYAWRKMLDAGASLVFGSDAPIDPIEPLLGIYAAVNRRRYDGAPGIEGWYPDQKLSMTEAIGAFTMGAAYASGREKMMGSISSGKIADLTIFDRDIFNIPADELRDVRISGTIVDGEFQYRTWD